MEAIYSSGSQALSLAPRTSLSSPSLTGISSVRREFPGRSQQSFGGSSSSKLRSQKERGRCVGLGAKTMRFRVMASLDSGPIMMVVTVATVSAASFVYLNYYSRRKKDVKEMSGSPASEPLHEHTDTIRHDLSSQNSEISLLHLQSVEEVEKTVLEAEERLSLEEDDEFQFQHQDTGSIILDTFKVESMDLPAFSQDNAEAVSLLEENEDVSSHIPAALAESGTLPSFVSLEELSGFQSQGSPEEIEFSSMLADNQAEMEKSSSVSVIDVPENGNDGKSFSGDHAGHDLHATVCNGSAKGHGREELHLLCAEDNCETEIPKFMNGTGVSLLVSYPASHDISTSSKSQSSQGLIGWSPLPTGHSEGHKSPVSFKGENYNHRKEFGKYNGTTTLEETRQSAQENQRVANPNGMTPNGVENFTVQLKTYNHLIRYGRLSECIELLEKMDRDGVLDTNKVYHAKFFTLCRTQKAVTEAFRFFKLIPNPTLSTFNMLMTVCASAQDSEGAAEVWKLVQEAGFKADCKLYTTLISTYGNCGKVDQMFKAFHEMVIYGVEPNAHTYGTLIIGCARAGQVPKAFGAYGMLQAKNVKPDRVIFNALITACSQSGGVDRAFTVLEDMLAEPHPIDPDHVTVGVLIKACINAGQVERVKEVYKMMQKYNIKGTAEVYTIAVSSCSRTCDWSFACSIYEDMKRNGINPDEMFLSVLIDVAGHAQNLDAAFEVLQDAISQSPELNLGIMPFSSLMGACSNNKNWQRALELYEEIISMGLKPTVTTMNALITALCEGNQLQKAIKILSEMKKMGLTPNDITYSMLFVSSERNDDFDCGLLLHAEAKKDGVPLNMVMCRCLTGMCSRRFEKATTLGEPVVSFKSGRAQLDNEWTSKALMIYREMVVAGTVPDVEVLSHVLGCLRLPHDVSLRERLIESVITDTETIRSRKLLALIDGFGQYDLRAFSLLEEAASLGIVPHVSFKKSPIILNARDLPTYVAEVYLLTVLKGLKYRLAAGARLPNMFVALPLETTKMSSSKGEKTVKVAGRVTQAVGALLRRLGLPYQDTESHGKIRINGRTIRRWFQPKLENPNSKQTELGLGFSGLNLGKEISNQQRTIRSGSYSLR